MGRHAETEAKGGGEPGQRAMLAIGGPPAARMKTRRSLADRGRDRARDGADAGKERVTRD